MTAANSKRNDTRQSIAEPLRQFPHLQSATSSIGWSAPTVLPIEVQGREQCLETYAYQGPNEEEQILVLIHRRGDVPVTTMPLVRIHSGCVTGDIFRSLRCDCHQQLQVALNVICEAPYGILLYFPYHEGRGIGLFKKMQTYAHQDNGQDTVDANIAAGVAVDARDYSLAATILKDLGSSSVRLLTNNPEKRRALSSKGVRVVDCVPIRIEPNKHNTHYLMTKRERMAHDL